MGYPEYLAARDFVTFAGQPVITYILMVSILIAVLSITYFWKKKDLYYDYMLKLLYIQTCLYLIGFVLLAWFHIKIYNTVIIEYPEVMRAMIPMDSSRFVIPLWIETEKLYFWAMCSSVFAIMAQKRRDVSALLGLFLTIFSVIVFYFSNPFKEPLPVVHSEISAWYFANGNAIFQVAGTLYGRINFYYNSAYMWMHPPMLFVAYASLIITFAGCIFMLVRNEKIYDDISYQFAKIGYVLLTAGMLLGYPWAIEAWRDSAWWWDPKISGSIMMWVLCSAYLHSHLYVNKMWKTTAVLGISCFVALVFTYLLTYIVPGIHSVVQP